MQKSAKNFFMFALVALFSLISWAQAEDGNWQGIDEAKVRLVSGLSAVGDHQEMTVGLHFKLKEGWKVYWRSPGDAGYPPEIDWEGSENLQSAQMRWPRPERFVVLGLETLGYKKEVVYPIRLSLKDTSQQLDLKGKLRFLTCSEICVPVETDLSLILPAGPAQPSADAQLIAKFESRVPLLSSPHNTRIESATIYHGASDKDSTLRLIVRSNRTFTNPDLMVEGPVELAFFKPKISLSEDGKAALVDVSFNGTQFLANGLDGIKYTVTLLDQDEAVELVTAAKSTDGAPSSVKGFSPMGAAGGATYSLPLVLALAVLGGLILNLMPCVLPVLSLKVLGLVSHGGSNPATVRMSFLASSAGIIFSFWVLAGVLIAMKMGGASIGWGIQFQQPLFLIALALIVLLFACNMWGFFEINLPSWLSDMGERSAHVHGLGGHFMTGAFATLLATPCSAPFLGTAVGFALSQGSVEILLVFSALGVGLALPYLLIALMPSLATRLPKPGVWMVHLRKVLGVILLGTAVWLLSVLWAQIGLDAVLVLSGLMVGIILAFLFRYNLKLLLKPLVIALFIASFAVPFFVQDQKVDKAVAEKMWVKFDPARIAEIVAEGQVVFVDVTADWCITCQVNKKLVLYQGEAYAALNAEDLVAMKADWTNPDQTIADYLASFKRYAIPFNAVYGPAAPEGIALPELLSEKDVLDAISKAKGLKE